MSNLTTISESKNQATFEWVILNQKYTLIWNNPFEYAYYDEDDEDTYQCTLDIYGPNKAHIACLKCDRTPRAALLEFMCRITSVCFKDLESHKFIKREAYD